MPNDAKMLSLGPGVLRWAPLGTAEPTNTITGTGATAKITGAWPAAWKEIGYTEDGSEFSYEISTDPVEVAQVLEPLFYRTTGRSGSVSFEMSENTVLNLVLAFNGGTVTNPTPGATSLWTYEPPDPGNEVRVMLGFESEDRQERWVFRQVFQGGTVSVARRKGADKATVPVEFMIEKPATAKPFVVYMVDVRSGGAVVQA